MRVIIVIGIVFAVLLGFWLAMGGVFSNISQTPDMREVRTNSIAVSTESNYIGGAHSGLLMTLTKPVNADTTYRQFSFNSMYWVCVGRQDEVTVSPPKVGAVYQLQYQLLGRYLMKSGENVVLVRCLKFTES